ncbi:CH domain containing protein [Grosmannia clavigera kw1407]|uniref:CH domain containing protein n=1 Tax=Grosmannia clavigera (strain kw1407 / UAMH 11150) TaxID=655863 RepID=F0XS86_GROCL|nr:CH domain containing protein [Grosmannia clavigera kw1407]EFW99457.1 CH domain containing protein [Grosmannia clavigera kw1407]
MATVSSLDGDLRRLRLDKYTPAAAREAREWVESVLGEPLSGSDLLDGLRDGVALCRLANLAMSGPGIRFKKSAMPFVQMENISHFLRACQAPPLSLQQHDVFLTVDLYEAKDPAQVLQCLMAFSRAANRVNPTAFPTAMGPRPSGRAAGGGGSTVGGNSAAVGAYTATAGGSGVGGSVISPSNSAGLNNGGGRSPTTQPSTWSKRNMEGATPTAPAWNIAQYGYIGGASQGNLGISFGGRRQITNSEPKVMSLAERERLRKAKEAETETRQKAKEAETEMRQKAKEAEAETRQQKEKESAAQAAKAEEKRKADEERRRWEEEEKQWKLTEEKRRRDEAEAEARLAEERQRLRSSGKATGGIVAAAMTTTTTTATTATTAATATTAVGGRDGRLHGQLLSQYQAEQNGTSGGGGGSKQPLRQHEDEDSRGGSAYSNRVRELEQELEQARQREQEYERERRGRGPTAAATGLSVDEGKARSRSRARSRSQAPGTAGQLKSPVPSRQDSWSRHEPEILRTPRSRSRHRFADQEPQRVGGGLASPLSSPPLGASRPGSQPVSSPAQPLSPRPLPDPRASSRFGQPQSPQPHQPQSPHQPHHAPGLASPISPQLPPRSRPLPNPSAYAATSSPVTKPGQSLLEREMELERQRQREWEDAQQATAAAAAGLQQATGTGTGSNNNNVDGIDGRWDVSQWGGFTGGDSQNRGAQGIGAGRRQIVGPRPLPGLPGQR